MVFGLNILTNLVARGLAYLILKYVVYRRSVVRNIIDFNNTGINKIGLRFFLSTLLGAILWSVGALAIVQSKIFGEDNLGTLVISYLIINILLFLTTKFIVDTKT